MNMNWQDLVALAVVFAAAGYLGRLVWGAITRRSSQGCGSACARCSAATASTLAREQLVSIGSIPRITTSVDPSAPQASAR
jgi:hypothetical protein